MAAASLRPRVILMEPAMLGNDLDGYQLGSLLRQGRRAEELLLVARSGRGQPRDRARAIEVGFDAFVLKPGTAEAILTLVNDWMRSSERDIPSRAIISPVEEASGHAGVQGGSCSRWRR